MKTFYNVAKKISAPSVDLIMTRSQYLRSIYAPRNGEYSILRRVFDGDMAYVQQLKSRPDGLFNERMRIFYNMANASVRRYMDSNSAPPRVEAEPHGLDEASIRHADSKTRWIEKFYRSNNMATLFIQANFYQSLLDSAIFHVCPDPTSMTGVRIELAVPEYYMPMPTGDDWNRNAYVIYAFRKQREHDIFVDPMTTHPQIGFTDVVVYWDERWYVRVEDGVEMVRIEHNLGPDFLVWVRACNIPIPHRYRGQGDVDQAVGLQNYINMLMSDFADMINYAANPITIVRGSKAGIGNLTFGPRAIWELERDGQAGFLQWSGAPPTAEAQILRSIQAFEDVSGVSSPAFGREIPSGTSGQAVRSLLAGFNTRLGTKQQLGGEALARMNMTAMCMAERFFPDRGIDIIGEDPKSGKREGRIVKPREFAGFYENKVSFDPTDPSTRFFQELEKKKEGLQSRYTTMKNLGTQNVYEELERIRLEATDEAQHANSMGLAQQGKLPPPGAPGAPGMPGAGGASGDPGFDPSGLVPPDADKAKLRELLLGAAPARPAESRAPKPALIASPNSTGGSTGGPQNLPDTAQRIGIDQVAALLRPGQGKPAPALNGAVAVIGDAAKQGYTEGQLQFAISDPADEQEIRQALGSMAQRASFTVMPFPLAQRDAVAIGGSPSKKATAAPTNEGPRTVKVDAFLGVIVTNVISTGSARVYTVAVQDDRGNFVPIGNTFPQRKIAAEQGELITIHIDGISKRMVAGQARYAFVKPTPVRVSTPASRPALVTDIEKLYAKGEPNA
jgi:hypothetical protein